MSGWGQPSAGSRSSLRNVSTLGHLGMVAPGPEGGVRLLRGPAAWVLRGEDESGTSDSGGATWFPCRPWNVPQAGHPCWGAGRHVGSVAPCGAGAGVRFVSLWAGMENTASKSETVALSWTRVDCTLQVREELLPQVGECKYLELVALEWGVDQQMDGLTGPGGEAPVCHPTIDRGP